MPRCRVIVDIKLLKNKGKTFFFIFHEKRTMQTVRKVYKKNDSMIQIIKKF